MSSHHIVRENQEPALLIKDIHSIQFEWLGQLLEWSPTVVTNQASYEFLHAQGYKVDIVLSHEAIASQAHVEWMRVDESDFISQGISLLLGKNHSAVTIIADEIDVEYLRDSVESMAIVWLHHNFRSIYVQSGFTKWRPQHERVFLEDNIQDLSVEGLIKEESNSYLTTSDGFYKINFSNLKPVLLTEFI